MILSQTVKTGHPYGNGENCHFNRLFDPQSFSIQTDGFASCRFTREVRRITQTRNKAKLARCTARNTFGEEAGRQYLW